MLSNQYLEHVSFELCHLFLVLAGEHHQASIVYFSYEKWIKDDKYMYK